MPTNRLWHIGGKPVVLAHRGGGNEEPENSIVAFERIRDKGFRFIETDVHATRDGVVVVFHDPVLDRVTDASGLIKNHTWRELSQIHDRSGNPILRLDNVLEHFPDTVFNIDAKANSVVRPLIATLKRSGAVERVSLASFSEARLKVLRHQLPGVRSSLGTAAIAHLVLAARGHASLAHGVPGPKRGVEAVQVPVSYGPVRILTPAFINLAHERGMAVHAWTINDEATMNELLDMGVDALITDEPTLAQRIIEERTRKN